MRKPNLQRLFFFANILVLFTILLVILLVGGQLVVNGLSKGQTYVRSFIIFAAVMIGKLVVDFCLANENERLQRQNRDLTQQLQILAKKDTAKKAEGSI